MLSGSGQDDCGPYCTAVARASPVVGPRYHACVDALASSRRVRGGDLGRAARHRRRRRRWSPGLSRAPLAPAAGAAGPAARALLAARSLAEPGGVRDLPSHAIRRLAREHSRGGDGPGARGPAGRDAPDRPAIGDRVPRVSWAALRAGAAEREGRTSAAKPRL